MAAPTRLLRSVGDLPGTQPVHRRAAQGRAARPPRGLGVAADRGRTGRPARGAQPGAGRSRPLARRLLRFRDFPHFIEVYLQVVDLIRDAEDVWTLTYEIGRELAAQQVRYAELTVTPYSIVVARHPGAGSSVEAIEDARHRRGRATTASDLRWCFDIPGESGVGRRRRRRSDSRSDERPDGLVSFGLGGPEAGVPRRCSSRTSPRPRRRAAQRAARRRDRPVRRRSGTRCAISAPSGSAHGIASVRGPGADGVPGRAPIPLEICPTSNVRTRAVPSLAEHPLPALVAAGVPVTINSDDPPMFGTTLERGVRGGGRAARPGRGGRRRPGPGGGHGVVPRRRAGKSALLAEIDAYAAQNSSAPLT